MGEKDRQMHLFEEVLEDDHSTSLDQKLEKVFEDIREIILDSDNAEEYLHYFAELIRIMKNRDFTRKRIKFLLTKAPHLLHDLQENPYSSSEEERKTFIEWIKGFGVEIPMKLERMPSNKDEWIRSLEDVYESKNKDLSPLGVAFILKAKNLGLKVKEVETFDEHRGPKMYFLTRKRQVIRLLETKEGVILEMIKA